MSHYIFVAQMGVDAAHDDASRRIYDERHKPEILSLQGVPSFVRYKLVTSRTDDAPTYCVIYKLDTADCPEIDA